jgi:hypothetical protein
MSGDYLHALHFNPKYIRLGTVLFGKRLWENFTSTQKDQLTKS